VAYACTIISVATRLFAAAMQIGSMIVHCKAELLEPGKFGFCHRVNDGSIEH